jgi:hypothetical protein
MVQYGAVDTVAINTLRALSVSYIRYCHCLLGPFWQLICSYELQLFLGHFSNRTTVENPLGTLITHKVQTVMRTYLIMFEQVDASFKAKSGHPGAPMGLAPVTHVLFNKMV